MAAPTLVPETGQGLPNANSYVSLEWAQDYFDTHLWPTEWVNATGAASYANAELYFASYIEWFQAEDSESGAYPAPAQPSAGDSVTIGGVTYTFASVFTGPYQVLIGPTVPATIANLAMAINGTMAGINVNYSNGTNANPVCTAIGYTSGCTLTAITAGASGNNIVVSCQGANLFFKNGLTFGGGADGTSARQIAALCHATRLIDQLVEFRGAKQSAAQALEWPRERVPNPDILDRTFTAAVANQGPWISDNYIPPRLKECTCEVALSLLKKDRTQELPQQGIGSLSIGNGALATTFVGTDSPKPITQYIKSVIGIYGNIRGDSATARLVRA